MNTTTLAGAAGRAAGTVARHLIHEVNWQEVAALVLDCLTALAILTLLAGRATRRAWDALPGLSEALGRWYARLLVPPTPVAPPAVHPLAALATDLEHLTCRELRHLVGTRRRLAKRELVELALIAGNLNQPPRQARASTDTRRLRAVAIG
jgi:hypothetical protein